MLTIAQMYITLSPIILAGILNMVWCSNSFGGRLKHPMDKGLVLRDGNRLFGDNKTWKGFWGMVAFGLLFCVTWGLICGQSGFLFENNYLYFSHANTVGYNALMGAALGFAYALFELPNSFLKRRLGIVPGKPAVKAWKPFFIFLDQADSVFGMVLVVALVYPMSLLFYLAYVLLGAATHIVFNMLLYMVGLRKNKF